MVIDVRGNSADHTTSHQMKSSRMSRPTSLSAITSEIASLNARLAALNNQENKVASTVQSFPKQLSAALGRPVSFANCIEIMKQSVQDAIVNATTSSVRLIKRNPLKGKRLSDEQRQVIRHLWAERQAKLNAHQEVEPLTKIAKRLKVAVATIYHYMPSQSKAA